MNPSWLLGNLMAYSVQVALMVTVAELGAAVLRLKQPRVMLTYWQALLAACLLLPLLELWQPMGLGPGTGSATITGTAVVTVDSLLDLFPLHTWVLLVLVAGVGIGLIRLALGLWRLGRYRRAALRVDPLPGTLREARALVRVAPSFYFSDRIESPVTFGWLHPAIIFPRRFERMDESEQRAIACHELLHVARRDWLISLLEELVLTFFWFHPAFWWAVRRIRLAREQVVDSQVVALSGTSKPYLLVKEGQIGAQMSDVGSQILVPRIDVGERHHRWKTGRRRSQAERKPVREIQGVDLFGFRGHEARVEFQFFDEIAVLVLPGLEIVVVWIRENEVQGQESSLDVVEFVLPAATESLL